MPCLRTRVLSPGLVSADSRTSFLYDDLDLGYNGRELNYDDLDLGCDNLDLDYDDMTLVIVTWAVRCHGAMMVHVVATWFYFIGVYFPLPCISSCLFSLSSMGGAVMCQP